MCLVCRQRICPATCPNAEPPEIIGHCKQCGYELTADYTFYIDRESNAFCSKGCALDFYGVTEEEYND